MEKGAEANVTGKLRQLVEVGPGQVGAGHVNLESMSVDGPKVGPVDSNTKTENKGKYALFGLTLMEAIQIHNGPILKTVLGCAGNMTLDEFGVSFASQSRESMPKSPKKKNTRRWKRTTREHQSSSFTGKVSSPMQKLIYLSHNTRKISKKISPFSKPRSTHNNNYPKDNATTPPKSASNVKSKDRFGSLGKLIRDKTQVIESLYMKSGEEGIMSLIKNLEKDLEGLLPVRKFLSMVDWLVEGD
ncbi:hypothetical protein QYF36_026238 [Acer negundo]|nr:hypothetical protein QYF36_026238 [Acer negundo]